MIKLFRNLRNGLSLIALVAFCPLNLIGQDVSSPQEMMKVAYDALREGKVDGAISIIHPAELVEFKTFAVKVAEEADEQLLFLFNPLETVTEIDSLSGFELLSISLQNSLNAVPNYQETLSEEDLEILGEIADGELIHVASRTLLPRPVVNTFKMHEGKWYQLIGEDFRKVMNGFDLRMHMQKQNVAVEDIADKVKVSLEDVLGYVDDGEGLVQLLCINKVEVDDFAYTFRAFYPIRTSDEAWAHLDDEDNSLLLESLRTKWGM